MIELKTGEISKNQNLILHILPENYDTITEKLSWLIEKGCEQQAMTMLRILR